MYTYEYPRASLTADCVVFRLDLPALSVLLIERKSDTFGGFLAIPGGFVEMDEDLDAAALRELEEETGLKGIEVEQLHTFGKPGRDPRGRVVTVAYMALINLDGRYVGPGDDASHASWHSIAELPPLAFDHADVMAMAIARLRDKARSRPIGMGLLPDKFTYDQLHKIYEKIMGKAISVRALKTKLLKLGFVKEVGVKNESAKKPVHLYSFDKKIYKELNIKGFYIEM